MQFCLEPLSKACKIGNLLSLASFLMNLDDAGFRRIAHTTFVHIWKHYTQRNQKLPQALG